MKRIYAKRKEKHHFVWIMLEDLLATTHSLLRDVDFEFQTFRPSTGTSLNRFLYTLP